MTTASTNGHGDRTCSDCESGYFGPGGLFCMTYKEHIDDERVAQECVAFDPHPNVQYPVEVVRDPQANELIRTALSKVPLPKREQVDAVVAAPPAPELVAACDEYLSLRHCTLFGQVFEIISPKGRAQAAEWLAIQMTAINFVAPVSL